MASKKMIIVESPAKAKTIHKMLGGEFEVTSSMGHIRDLPEKKLGVDIENGFEPTYVLSTNRKKTIDELKKVAKSCSEIYLAPDPDREGEAIAWHLKETLAPLVPAAAFYRISYNEVTKRAVQAAVAAPTQLNINRINAQQARRILDRIVGYKVSPLLWRSVKRGLSAGRVQSVALRLVCEREAQIQAFVPENYWVFGAIVRKLMVPLTPFATKLVRINGEKADIRSEPQAISIKQDLDGCALSVQALKSRRINRQPYPPFITSTLQQAASNTCSFSPRRTMSIAQELYEGINLGSGAEGLITYMRTDSVAVAKEAIDSCRSLITKQFGNDYCPETPNYYKSRSGAQEAHEAIRPTDVTRTPESIKKYLKPDAYKLYRLIWQRFVASQMTPAVIEQRTVVITAIGKSNEHEPDRYEFQATASEILFPGHRAVTGEKEKKADDSDQVDELPALTEGEPLSCVEILCEDKQTKPPARYSEASLVKALEANGVGRPSTYAQTLSTLQSRNYISVENRSLIPSDLGMQTNAFLVSKLADLFDIGFTAEMETSLDKIEEGELDWKQMLAAFYSQFEKWVDNAKEPPADPEHVKRLLSALAHVKTWSPPVKRGRRTYSDETFVTSIQDALDETKPISPRQLETLAKIACRYRDQIHDLESVLRSVNQESLLTAPELQPPDPNSLKKIAWLESRDLDESTASFIKSLGDQVRSNRKLTSAQLNSLNKTVLGQSRDNAESESIKASLGLADQSLPEDHESKPILDAMAAVTDWQPPVKRGKREFDDKAFYESLAGQFNTKGYLSDRQRGALKRMVKRYKEQIPEFDKLAQMISLDAPSTYNKRRPSKPRRARAKK